MKDETPKVPVAKKLTLNKETIRILAEREMQEVKGGGGPGHYSVAPCSPSSPPATCPPP
jgi:natural product precursor